MRPRILRNCTFVISAKVPDEEKAIGPDDDMEERRAEIAAAAEEVDKGDGVILLTDMFGGTPSNLAISLLGTGQVEVIAGINLPMLIKLASVRKSGSLDEVVAAAQEAGRRYINVASRVLSGEADDQTSDRG